MSLSERDGPARSPADFGFTMDESSDDDGDIPLVYRRSHQTTTSATLQTPQPEVPPEIECASSVAPTPACARPPAPPYSPMRMQAESPVPPASLVPLVPAVPLVPVAPVAPVASESEAPSVPPPVLPTRAEVAVAEAEVVEEVWDIQVMKALMEPLILAAAVVGATLIVLHKMVKMAVLVL